MDAAARLDAPIRPQSTGWWAALRPLHRGLLIALAVALPCALAISALSVLATLQANRAAFVARQQRMAEVAQLGVDARLALFVATARTLANSPQLQEGGDLAVFARFAEAPGLAVGANAVGVADLHDPAAPVLAYVGAAGRGYPAPRGTRAQVRAVLAQVLRTRLPAVSDVYRSSATGRPVIAVIAPALERAEGPRQGQVRAAVWLQVDAELFVETLQRIPVSADGVVAIYDAASATVARSRDNDIYAGRPAVRFPNMLYDGSDGTRQLYSPNFGRQTLYGFHHLDVAPGWHVTVFEPMDLASTILLGSLSSILPALTLVPLLLAMFVGVLWLIARASRQSHLELEHVLADVPVSIYIDDVTPDGGRLTLFRSVRAGRALGFSRAEVERFGNAYVRTFDETGAQRFAAFQTEAVVAGSASIELPVRHRDGSWRTLRYEERRLPAPRVGSVRVIGTVLDITDDVARESQQRQMERLAVLGEVAVGIAHQLSQPLTMLSMASQNALRSLRRDPPDIGRAEGKLAQIDAHVERMAGVLDHIRLFGRAGDAPRAPFDVADCVRKARLLVEGRFSRACVALVLEISSGLTPVEGHEVMLEQVLLSLLANAADAYEARPDIIDREVRIIVRPRGEELVIAVLDRAGGIPPEVIGRLFDPFFTTKEPGHGTGLGLSISLAIITEMGGRLSAYNEGTGACLEIALPVVTAGPPALVADGVA